MTHALRAVPKMDPGVYLAVNCSHRAAVSTDLATLIEPLADRLVLEITEHEAVEDYDDLVDALAPLRARGARVAIDDAGAGLREPATHAAHRARHREARHEPHPRHRH